MLMTYEEKYITQRDKINKDIVNANVKLQDQNKWLYEKIKTI